MGPSPDPKILLDKTLIKVITEAKFLRLVYERILSFESHILIQYLETSCQRALDILRVVGHIGWGADRRVLLRLYRSLVHGCIVYGSTRQSNLKQLDPIHHQGLRIALGAFCTSPAQSLYVKAHEPSLSLRPLKLSLNDVTKLKSHPDNAAYSCAFEPQNAILFEVSPTKIPPLCLRFLPLLEKSGIILGVIDDVSALSSLDSTSASVRLDLATFEKETTDPVIHKQFYSKRPDFQNIV